MDQPTIARIRDFAITCDKREEQNFAPALSSLAIA
jgi:hypothetical protein